MGFNDWCRKAQVQAACSSSRWWPHVVGAWQSPCGMKTICVIEQMNLHPRSWEGHLQKTYGHGKPNRVVMKQHLAL